MAARDLDELVLADADELREWLRLHHATSPGVWLALTRKGGTVTTVTWQQAVDEALCVGWIDGQGRKRDDETSSIRYTPRGPRSTWSRRNVGHVARLEAEGQMLPAGRANPAAQAMFDVLTRTNRYALIHRLGAVKRAETRKRKIAEYVEMLARHQTPYPQRARPDDGPA